MILSPFLNMSANMWRSTLRPCARGRSELSPPGRPSNGALDSQYLAWLNFAVCFGTYRHGSVLVFPPGLIWVPENSESQLAHCVSGKNRVSIPNTGRRCDVISTRSGGDWSVSVIDWLLLLRNTARHLHTALQWNPLTGNSADNLNKLWKYCEL